MLAQQNSYTLIEDFEDPSTQNNLGGYWYGFNDNGSGGKSSLKQSTWEEGFAKTGGYLSKGCFRVDVLLDKGSYQWSPYYAFGTDIPKTAQYSTAHFAGISYWHKGVAHRFRIDTDEVEDYDYYQTPVPAASEWTLVTIDFKMMNQGGWGKRVPLNLDNYLKFVWELNDGSGTFEIDQINMVKEIKYEKMNDLKILPAEIPAVLPLKGNINNALNDLSKKYLTKGMNFTNWGEVYKIEDPNPKSWKYNEATVKLQAEQGILGIRLPIDLDLYLENRPLVLNGSVKKIVFDTQLFTILDSMNIWTKRHGLSLTIDYHAYDGTYNRAASKDPAFRAAMASIWKVVAAHYISEKRPDLFFELTNEPCLSLPEGEYIDQEDWNILAQAMIDSIRKVDAKRPIIFGDTKWYSLDELVKNKPFKDPNIIYCFHMYDPFVFTHQGASWNNMGSMKNVPFPYSPERWSTEFRDFGIVNATPSYVKDQMRRYHQEGNKQHIKNRLAKVKNWAYDHNVPLICNEWGALPNTSKIEDLNAYFKTMGEIFKEMDISWQVWFGIMDNEHKLLPGMAEALDLHRK